MPRGPITVFTAPSTVIELVAGRNMEVDCDEVCDLATNPGNTKKTPATAFAYAV